MSNFKSAMTGVVVFSLTPGLVAPAIAEPVAPPQHMGDKAAKGQAPRTVTFQTSDGITIEGDYYPPNLLTDAKEARSPIVILIHMYPADRKSWAPIAMSLSRGSRGLGCMACAVLAYDIRGHGGSTESKGKNLKSMYDRRDPDLFKDAWRDVKAAKKWLATQPDCDVSRIALIGASIGCSISLDYAGRDPSVRAVACLSPGTDYFGVDSIDHIKKCGKVAVLLISPEGEYEAVQKLVKASGGKAKGEKHAGGREHHGTGMLAESYKESGNVRKSILEHVVRAFVRMSGKPNSETIN